MAGEYERVGVVVRSANTTIWKGFDSSLKRDVALKHLTGANAAEAARREATALAGLQHLNIVSVYDVLEESDGVWLIEQWITGAPLSTVLAHTGKLRSIDALALIHGALAGLAYAHDRDVLHGDVAPANILIDPTGTPMLVDFGLAVSPGHTSLGGTPGYMSPEAAARRPVDKRSDVYSACVVLSELLTGTAVFTRSSSLASAHQQASDVPQLKGVDGPVAAVLQSGLDPRPDSRPADAAVLLTLLEEAAEQTYGKGWLALASLGGLGATASTIGAGLTLTGTAAAASGAAATASTAASTAGTAASTVSRGKLLAAGAIGAAVIVGVAAFLLLRPDPPTPTAAPATTTTTPPPVAAPPPPAPEGPILRGTYEGVATYRTATVTTVLTIASDCPRCDATVTAEGNTVAMSWNGTGWQSTVGGGCGPTVNVLTPTAVVDGVVQNYTTVTTWLSPPAACMISGPGLGSGTRIGN